MPVSPPPSSPLNNQPFSPSVFFVNEKLLSLPSPNRLFASPSGKGPFPASPAVLRSPLTSRQREWLSHTPGKWNGEGKENLVNGTPLSKSGNHLVVPAQGLPLTLAQQLKCINCKINGPPGSASTHPVGGGDESFIDDAHDCFVPPSIDVRDETIGDSSQSGDDHDNGWKALVLLQRTKEKDALLAQAEQVLRRTEGLV